MRQASTRLLADGIIAQRKVRQAIKTLKNIIECIFPKFRMPRFKRRPATVCFGANRSITRIYVTAARERIDDNWHACRIIGSDQFIEQLQPSSRSRDGISAKSRKQLLELPGGVVTPLFIFRRRQRQHQNRSLLESFFAKRDFL